MADAAPTQATRTLALFTPLGDDKLFLAAARGSESLGRLFHFSLDLTAQAPVDAGDILCQNVTIRLTLLTGDFRYFNGYISRFTLVAIDESTPAEKIYHYRADMVPWLWFLTRQADCRIFQDMTVPDIIQKIFKDRGFSDCVLQLTGTYRKWINCVQYRETDFNFISRLMENEGIYYYFAHEDGKHMLTLCDGPTAHKAIVGTESLHHDDEPDPGADHDAFLWNWSFGQEVTPNQCAVNEFDPLQPKTQLLSPANVTHAHDPGPFEIYDYPGGYVTGDEGKNYVKIRMEEMESVYEVGRGSSSARAIFAGATFTFEDHPTSDGEYLITAVSYRLKNNTTGSGETAEGEDFSCQLACIPSKYVFRAPRTTPKPVVNGPQTAIVVGPAGEEIYTDKYGRVKVRFHWDRDSKGDENSSCWIRVSQQWAGKKWGFLFIPRTGHEVVVDFLEGDPDSPIITGRVYNGDNMPPYDLPAQATKSTIKSYSSKGGGGFNEFRFEDKKGSEQIFLHAQRQMDTRIGANLYETNGGDREEITGYDDKGDRNVLICNDNNFHLKGDQYNKIDGGRQQTITTDVIEGYLDNLFVMVTTQYEINTESFLMEASEYISQKASDVYLWGTQEFHIKGAKTYFEGTNEMHLYGKGPLNIGFTNDVNIKGANINLQATTSINLKSDMAVNIEGATAVNIKMGGNFIALGPSGMAINGAPTVLVNSGGSAGPAQSAQAATQADQAYPSTDHTILDPIDAAAADSGQPGGHGVGTWTPRTHNPTIWLAQHALPPPPPPPPPHLGPNPDRPAYAKMIRIEWVEEETWCSEGADIRGDTANYGDPDQETVTVDGGGKTYATFPATISGQTFSEHWEVLEVLPPSQSDDHIDLDGHCAGQTTPKPLKVNFIPTVKKAHYANGRAHFDLAAKDFVIKITSTIEFVKGYMAAVVKLGAAVPAGTGGLLDGTFTIPSGYRWMKKLNGSNVYWDGSAWQAMPAGFLVVDAVRFTVGFYKDGDDFTCQYGGTFPEALPEWDITSATSQNKIKAWEDNIKNTWTHAFDVKRHECRSKATSCCRYAVECAVDFHQNDDFSDGMTIVASGNDGNDYRSNDSLFFIDEPRIYVAAHEFGHHLDNPDEYAGSNLGPAGIDNTSLMGNVNTPGVIKVRHFAAICKQFATMVSDEFGKSYTYDAVAHI